MIIGIFGNLSSGKSALSTMILKDAKKEGAKIISVMYVKFADEILDFESLVHKLYEEKQKNIPAEESLFFNSYLLIDEIHNVLSSQKTGSEITNFFREFITQLGKLDCTLVYTSQTWDTQTDKLLRLLTDVIILCMRIDQKGNPVIDKRIVNYKIYIYCKIYIKIYGGADIIEKEVTIDPENVFNDYITREIVLFHNAKDAFKKLKL